MSKVLGLRTCRADGTAYNGFRWPKDGHVEAPDWSTEPVCGKGLHALLWGEGDASLLDWSESALWQVVEFDDQNMVKLDGKVKFPRCSVLHTGTRETATQFVYRNGGAAYAIGGLILTGGYGSTLTGGDRSTLTGGYGSTLTGGYGSTLTGCYGSTLTGGEKAELRLRWWDDQTYRYRTVIAYVGEDGIEANTPYRLDENNKFVEVVAATV